ncbi:ATP-binding cassette domain-containing protein [Candidatus Haliotispira prima]|uniref:ATP-binding cassette domain-containing protein n=1 Tax=Candidatus Haliotispira prima TaxID=3034016 RepID=A0ABY8MKE2_9SPIO|nr:ATP-binding cassette domain-containing protein [Candidatus Haliotispira prima]
MIRLRDACMIFYPGTADEAVALKPCNLQIENGDFTTIIGTNGAGKSTLFNAISGHFPLSSGQIFFGERDISRMKEHRRAKLIGRIFQNPAMGTAAGMSLEHNLIIAGSKDMRGLNISLNAAKRQKFREHLRHLDMHLEERLKDNVGLFSGGQRQAITLLMMVLSAPELILLDEHTAALDPANAAKVMELTRYFVEEYKLTAMMITHDMSQAIDYGNRLLMMDRGEIILDIRGEEKQALRPQDLVDKFRELRGTQRNLGDQTMLTV